MPRFIRIRLRPGETLENARQELLTVMDARFHRTFPNAWAQGVDANGCARTQFVCYLNLWAMVNDGEAATAVREWWRNRIISDSHNVTYEVFNQHITQDQARNFRDHEHGDYEAHLQALLPHLGPEDRNDPLTQCRAELAACQAQLEAVTAELERSRAELEQCKADHRNAFVEFAAALNARLQQLQATLGVPPQ